MKETIWAQLYRPSKLEDCILPENLYNYFKNLLDKKESLNNMIFHGMHGIGKTSLAKLLVSSIGAEYIVINGSLEGNIDTLRTRITDFATSVSFNGKKKYVIIDEADFLNKNSIQPALRNFIEEHSKNCGFIFTCNYINRLMVEIRSRCEEFEFNFGKENKYAYIAKFFERCCFILEDQHILYNKEIVANIINNNFPDFRKIIINLQKFKDRLNDFTVIVEASKSTEYDFDALLEYMKIKDFKRIRQWVNIHLPESSLEGARNIFIALFEWSQISVTPAFIPNAVLIIADYLYKAEIIIDQQINLTAALTQLMLECSFV